MSKFYGKYRALVCDIKDPEHMGRIRVRCPSVLGEYTSAWCTPCVPCAFSDGGALYIPNVNEGVWVEFEEGDPTKPIWTGFWWKPNRTPQQQNEATNTKFTFVSRSQHIIEIDDVKNTVVVKMKNGTRLELGNGIILTAPTNTIVKLQGNVEVTGTLKVSGDIYEGNKKLIDKYTIKA